MSWESLKGYIISHPRESIALSIHLMTLILVIIGSIVLSSDFNDVYSIHSTWKWAKKVDHPARICNVNHKGNPDGTIFNNPTDVGDAIKEDSVFWGSFFHFVLSGFPPIFKTIMVIFQFWFFFKPGELYKRWYKTMGLGVVYFVIGSVLYTVPALPILQIKYDEDQCMKQAISEYFIITAKLYTVLFFIMYFIGIFGLIGSTLIWKFTVPLDTAPIWFNKRMEGAPLKWWWAGAVAYYLGLFAMLISFIFLWIFVIQSPQELQMLWLFFLIFEIIADVLCYFLPRKKGGRAESKDHMEMNTPILGTPDTDSMNSSLV